MRHIRTLLLVLLFLVAGVASPPLAYAHTLGIDKADLVELPDNRYQLTPRVSRSVAPAITSLGLPSHCQFDGSPRGERGDFEIRFTFRCERGLTADDSLILPWKREGVLLTVRWKSQPEITELVLRRGSEIRINFAEFSAGSRSWLAAARRYTALGIEHILLGIDHLLFVFCLLLIVRDGWMLVKTITAFTAAHSITLALATFGLVEVSVRAVEAAIALSIVFLAAEIVRAQAGRIGMTYRQPWLVSFGFGLLHGFGFASALREIDLPPAEIPAALLFFNIGVEIGQLLFVAAVVGVMWGVSKGVPSLPQRRARMVPVYAVGAIATFWFADRTLALIL